MALILQISFRPSVLVVNSTLYSLKAQFEFLYPGKKLSHQKGALGMRIMLGQVLRISRAIGTVTQNRPLGFMGVSSLSRCKNS